MNDVRGLIIGGSYGEILVRQKSDYDLEIGELLISDEGDKKILLQVHNVFYGSQISKLNLEKISGMNLEGDDSYEFFSNTLRNYKLALVKSLVTIKEKKLTSSKDLPKFFSEVRSVKKDDLKFLSQNGKELFLGSLRSGTKNLNVPIYLDGEKVLSHHILITGTTGRGKSVLMKNLIWNATKKEYAGLLVLDPHDEYYGRKSKGMKDFENREMVAYYSQKDVPVGQRSLKLNVSLLRPDHFDFLNLSSPQRQAMYLYFKKYGDNWISNLMTQDLGSNEIHEMSLAVLRRRVKIILDIDVDSDSVSYYGVFDSQAGKSVVTDILNLLEEGKTVIVDTSSFSGNLELLVASLITTEVLNRYKNYNSKGILPQKPVINIVLEEAPRVIGKAVLEQGPNVFSTIAREGRKFKVGLSAITQLPSLIPKEVLANINTKIILGTEMNSERQAIIESASQDLSTDNRNIAALDRGEAIISSNFSRFALPISIPFFDDVVEKEQEESKNKKNSKSKNSFNGMKIN